MRKILLSLTISITGVCCAVAEDTSIQPCGTGENVCGVALGDYNVALPQRENPESQIPAVIYFHGAGGSGERSLKNREMVEAFLARGYAVIAPSGQVRPGRVSRFGRLWSFHPERTKIRDEMEFTKSVLEDASKKFNINRDQILMTGFSIGGSLTWYLACEDNTVAKAYAPVAGAFWRPHPVAQDCSGPVKLFHTHGWVDGTVPLEGRPLRSSEILQGDVFHGMNIMRQVNDCKGLKANQFDTSGKFWKRWWTKCHPDSALQFNLFSGGHRVPEGWANEAIDWFEALDQKNEG